MKSSRLGQREFYQDVGRLAGHMQDPFVETSLLSALLLPNRFGGGRLRFAFDGQGPQNWGAGYLTGWTETSLADADYATTGNGAPYVSVDGANDYLAIADAAWQEIGSASFLVGGWCYLGAALSSQVIASKYEYGTDKRAWRLGGFSGVLGFRVSPDGTLGAAVTVLSGYAETTSVWYCVLGYYQPSTTLNIYVGAASETALTKVANTTSIPAAVFDTDAALQIGAELNGGAAANHWQGRVSQVLARANAPATNIDSLVDRYFKLTQRYFL